MLAHSEIKDDVRRAYDRSKMRELMAIHCRPERLGGWEGYCIDTANAVCDFFIEDQKQANISKSFAREDDYLVKMYNQPLCISNRTFLQKETDGTYAQPVAQALLSPSSKPEHRVFKLDFDYEIHSLAIEKESDGTTTQWTVYQSHSRLFTLDQWNGKETSDWLGKYIPDPSDPAHKVKKFYSDSFIKFGRGKSLNSDEIKEFTENLIGYCSSVSEMYVNNREEVRPTVYEISPSFLNRFIAPSIIGTISNASSIVDVSRTDSNKDVSEPLEPVKSDSHYATGVTTFKPAAKTPLLDKPKEDTPRCCVIL